MKISNSKRQLAQLLIEAGVTQFPDGANWVAQDKDDKTAWFHKCKDVPNRVVGCDYWDGYKVEPVQLPTLIPNWHQTVLSRDEFDQIVAETVVQSESQPLPATAPTLDQLLQDWRNADDYAQRKQTEADEAAAMRDERWQAVQARAGGMGVTVGQCESVAADDDGWIKWSGVGHPVEDGAMVDIVLRDGRKYNGQSFLSDSWRHTGGDLDIVAYRLARP